VFCGRLEANHEAMNHSSPWSFRCEGEQGEKGRMGGESDLLWAQQGIGVRARRGGLTHRTLMGCFESRKAPNLPPKRVYLWPSATLSLPRHIPKNVAISRRKGSEVAGFLQLLISDAALEGVVQEVRTLSRRSCLLK